MPSGARTQVQIDADVPGLSADEIQDEIYQCHGTSIDDADEIHTDDQAGFLYFLANYVYILDPPPGEGIIKWTPWPYLVEVAKLLVTERLLVILKARQLGISWLVAAYVLWLVVFRSGAKALLLSQGEVEATELRRKARFIWSHLPPWLQMVTTKDNDSTLEFGGNDSGIQAFPSTQNAGSGFTGSVVVTDEHSKHPHAADNFGTVKPTIDAGGQFISMSTASYLADGTFFSNLEQAAHDGTNGFRALFLGALLRPGRDMAWYREREIEASADPLTRLTFKQEYPLTRDEARIIVAGVPVFDPAALERLTAGVKPPVFEEKYDLGYLRIWQRPVVGRIYVAGADVSYGLGAPDAACCQVLDWRTGMHVASLHGRFPPEDLIARAVVLCKLFNSAFLGVEENGIGQLAIRTLEASRYREVYFRDWAEAQERQVKPEKLGWHTGTNRSMMVGDLGANLVAGTLDTMDAETVRELCTFVHLKGKQIAAAGCHDDRVLALAIAQQMRDLPFLQARASGGEQRSYAGIGKSR